MNAKIFGIISLIAIIGLVATANARVIQPGFTPHHASLSDLKAFIAGYIPNAITSDSVFINESVNGYNYTIMQINSSGDNYIVFNMSNLSVNDQSFVLDQATNFKVLRPFLISKYFPNSTVLGSLQFNIRSYQANAQPALADCLQETGLNNFLCPAHYNTTSCIQKTCQSVPICFDALQGRVGKLSVGVPLGFIGGIMNFSWNYTILNTSYNSYYSLSSNITQANIGSNLQQMSGIISTIELLNSTILQDPLFLYTNVTKQRNNCISYQGVQGGPWYCYSTGFCQNPNFNITLLENLQSQISAILSTPISNTSITNIAIRSANYGAQFFEPKYVAGQSATFNALMAATYPKYLSLYNNMTFLASHYQNSSLQSSIAMLAAVELAINQSGINQNFTSAGLLLNNTITNSTKTYGSAAAKYLPLYKSAYNSTSLILLRELDFQVPPTSVSALATQQSAINAKLNGRINASTAASLSAQISSISGQAHSILPPFSPGGTIKAVDGGMLNALLASPTTPVASKLAAAPTYAAAISFFIGIIILLIIYFLTYFRLQKEHKLNMNPGTQRAWMMLFVIMFILVLIYTATTYSYAAGANDFLPASGFVASATAANTIYIMANQSIAYNASVQQCVTALETTIKGFGKTYYYTTFNSNGCTYPGNSSITGSACVNKIYSSYDPTIIINPGSNSTIVYKGLYGDTLYVTGTAASGTACPLNAVARVV